MQNFKSSFFVMTLTLIFSIIFLFSCTLENIDDVIFKSDFYGKWNYENPPTEVIQCIYIINENNLQASYLFTEGPVNINRIINTWTLIENNNNNTKKDYPSGYKISSIVENETRYAYWYLHKNKQNFISLDNDSRSIMYFKKVN